MPKQNKLKRLLTVRNRLLKVAKPMIVVGLFLFVCFSVVVSTNTPALAAASNTINFQARLEQADGAIVPDGSYNVEFKLYDAATSTGSTQGSCTGDTSCLWVEDWLNSNSQGIQVHNGYLTASLGSITPFPSTINWNQQLYLTMNIGGTGTTPTWNGEMAPRLLLTAVPYAFQANQLAQYNATTGYNSTLSIVQPTGGNQIFQIANQAAAGTYNLCIQGAASSTGGCAPSTGGSGYIQNQNTAAQASSNFWISGTGQATTLQGNTSVLTPLLDTSTVTALKIGTTNASSITIGNVTNTATTSLIANTTLNLGNNANNKTINIGATGTTANTTAINIGTSTGAAQTLYLGGNGTSTGSNASTTITAQAGATAINLTNTGLNLQTFTNSPTAFQVQNASGTNLLTANTTNMVLSVDSTYSPMTLPSSLSVGSPTSGGSLAASTT